MLMGMAMALYLFSTLLNAIAGEAIKESFDFHPWWIELVVFGLLALLIIADISNWKKGFAPKLQAYHGFSFLLLWIVITVSTYQLKALTFIPFLTLGIIMIFAVVNDERSISTQFEDNPTNSMYFASIFLGIAISAFTFFSTNFYSYIKPQFGGGLPPRVRIILAEGKTQFVDKLGYPQKADVLLSEALLIDSTDHEYLLLVKSSENDQGTLIQFRRELVEVPRWSARASGRPPRRAAGPRWSCRG